MKTAPVLNHRLTKQTNIISVTNSLATRLCSCLYQASESVKQQNRQIEKIDEKVGRKLEDLIHVPDPPLDPCLFYGRAGFLGGDYVG